MDFKWLSKAVVGESMGLGWGRRSPFPLSSVKFSPAVYIHVYDRHIQCILYMPTVRPAYTVYDGIYMYIHEYTRGLGSHKPIVRVVGRQEDVRGRRIHVFNCVLGKNMNRHRIRHVFTQYTVIYVMKPVEYMAGENLTENRGKTRPHPKLWDAGASVSASTKHPSFLGRNS